MFIEYRGFLSLLLFLPYLATVNFGLIMFICSIFVRSLKDKRRFMTIGLISNFIFLIVDIAYCALLEGLYMGAELVLCALVVMARIALGVTSVVCFIVSTASAKKKEKKKADLQG